MREQGKDEILVAIDCHGVRLALLTLGTTKAAHINGQGDY